MVFPFSLATLAYSRSEVLSCFAYSVTYMLLKVSGVKSHKDYSRLSGKSKTAGCINIY